MDKIFNLHQLHKNLTSEDLKKGSFGIEWEGLRVHNNGELSLRPHPEIFGNKLNNPYITTDFSESQIEIITPTFDTIDDAFSFFSFMSDLVNSSLPDDEYLWFQSLPCILPESSKIPIAKYKGRELAEESMEYREGLAKKYGLRKQLISGIHFNFSFEEELIQKLYERVILNDDEDALDLSSEKEDNLNLSYGIENGSDFSSSLENDSKMSYKDFKDNLYLKITRNYIRYVWLIIYLTGCSVAAHDSFTPECTKLMDKKDNRGSFYSENGPSFRNASCGYKNLEHLYPDYSSVSGFADSVQGFIDDGTLSQAKELYTQIRLKSRDPRNLLESLKNDGIKYVEIRTFDINPFYKCGLIKRDMEFLHLFLIYLLIAEESDYANWQEDAIYNEEKTAESAYDPDMRLIKDGEKISLEHWGLEILDEMEVMCKTLEIGDSSILDLMRRRIVDPNLTYGKRLTKLVKEEGYIESQIKLSRNNKLTSKYLVENTDLIEEHKFKEYVPIALQGAGK
ncbi:MAG: glutamate--cysteine ligase [Methanobrevibacter sp.]|nr:glutamate--cysteine ligase [Methanobrevibacter sp.]